ncbi:MAG: hypothetical protein ACRENI_11205 [Gemmatimonadaceae bacterium]
MNVKTMLARPGMLAKLAVDGRLWLTIAMVASALWVPSAEPLSAQVVTGGDFDVCDYCGTLTGTTAKIRGRSGFGTERAIFVLINAANDAQDVDRDGYTPGFNFTNLAVVDTSNFLKTDNPDIAITADNLVIADFLNPLNNGFQNQVAFYVNIPAGTPAGIFTGIFTIEDTTVAVGTNANQETLRRDEVQVEIEVLPNAGIGLVRPDTSAELDSLVLRGRAGQTVSGVVRVANLGNVDLGTVRLEATDLVATSGTGLRIRREQISFSPVDLPGLQVGDTARVVVTVRIPLGILAGTYRGDLILQGEGLSARRVPLIVIVTTIGEIVFETNPVIGRAGDLAVIIFNADAGTEWELRIFDMMALTVFADDGVVFAGSAGDQGFPGDEAVRFTWPLVNGIGEPVAGGMYYVIINAIQDGELRQLRDKLMVIR